MGNPVLIVGESGVGKTYAIKTLNPDKAAIFLCEKSRLPFREKFNTYYVRNMKRVDENNKEQIVRQSAVIQTVLRNPKDPKKIYVIDDSQYLMANEFFDRAYESGYQKFTDIGKNFRDLIHRIKERFTSKRRKARREAELQTRAAVEAARAAEATTQTEENE